MIIYDKVGNKIEYDYNFWILIQLHSKNTRSSVLLACWKGGFHYKIGVKLDNDKHKL